MAEQVQEPGIEEVQQLVEGFDIEFPFAPAAGTLNDISIEAVDAHVRDVAVSPAAFVMPGSGTLLFRWGNQYVLRDDGSPDQDAPLRKVYDYNPITGEEYNSMGLGNPGHEAFLPYIPGWAKLAEDHGKPLIMSWSPTGQDGEYDDPGELLAMLAYKSLERGAHGVEVNYACPNIVTEDGDRKPILGWDLEGVLHVRDVLQRELGDDVHIQEKWAPFFTELSPTQEVMEKMAADLAFRGLIKAVVTMNTDPFKQPKQLSGKYLLDVPEGKAGMSGPATSKLAQVNVDHVADALIGTDTKLVAAGAVWTAGDIQDRIERGAVAASGVGVFWQGREHGQSFGQTATRLATDYLELEAA